jgi:hypothetical protein
MYGDRFIIAPLSVLVDPVRAMRVLGLEEGGKFSDKVLYIYRKQLEEADIIVINKCDLLETAKRTDLRQALQRGFPPAEILEVSAREGTGLDAWFDRITAAEQTERRAMAVEYELYAEGEALLGWLNCTAELSTEGGFDADAVLKQLAGDIQKRLQTAGAEIAHLKMTLSPDTGLGGIAVINLVRNDYAPEVSLTLEEPVESGQLIINLRAEAAPEVLHDSVQAAFASLTGWFAGLKARVEHLEHFRPGKPMPTHRMTTPV